MLDAGRLDTPHTQRVLRQLHTLGSLADDVELHFVNVVEFLGISICHHQMRVNICGTVLFVESWVCTVQRTRHLEECLDVAELTDADGGSSIGLRVGL